MIAGRQRVLLDLGTGDGAAVVRAARAEAGVLAVGVDTDAASLREVSQKAHRKGGVANALFLVGDAAEALEAFRGHVDELRITLPWGSLLQRVLEGERAFALAVAGSL
ncbi:MAG TPA: class I SAM-dependent methyltransferase [Chloroflexota bacterium]|nr:class I SAM-dependent methyltransferase [Chloroflexota bacterium]